MDIMGLIFLIKKQALHNLGKSWAICAFQVPITKPQISHLNYLVSHYYNN
jgi:hypothetical protein